MCGSMIEYLLLYHRKIVNTYPKDYCLGLPFWLVKRPDRCSWYDHVWSGELLYLVKSDRSVICTYYLSGRCVSVLSVSFEQDNSPFVLIHTLCCGTLLMLDITCFVQTFFRGGNTLGRYVDWVFEFTHSQQLWCFLFVPKSSTLEGVDIFEKFALKSSLGTQPLSLVAIASLV